MENDPQMVDQMTLPCASDSQGLLSKDFLNPVASAKHVSNCPIIYCTCIYIYMYVQCSYLEL